MSVNTGANTIFLLTPVQSSSATVPVSSIFHSQTWKFEKPHFIDRERNLIKLVAKLKRLLSDIVIRDQDGVLVFFKDLE